MTETGVRVFFRPETRLRRAKAREGDQASRSAFRNMRCSTKRGTRRNPEQRPCARPLDSCLDQVRFMASLLQLDGLLPRIEDYVDRRGRGGLGPRLAPEARHLLGEALLRGSVARGEASRIMGLPGRSARRILSQLVSEGLLVSDTPKGAIRLAFPMRVVGFYFPQLFPDEALTRP